MEKKKCSIEEYSEWGETDVWREILQPNPGY